MSRKIGLKFFDFRSNFELINEVVSHCNSLFKLNLGRENLVKSKSKVMQIVFIAILKNKIIYFFQIDLFYYNSQICLGFHFSFRSFYTICRKKRHQLVKTFLYFLKTVVRTFCATCTVTGYSFSIYKLFRPESSMLCLNTWLIIATRQRTFNHKIELHDFERQSISRVPQYGWQSSKNQRS